MVIDDVVALTRPQHHGNHVLAEKIRLLAIRMIAPVRALGVDFTHADRDLGWAQFGNRYGMQTRFAGQSHGRCSGSADWLVRGYRSDASAAREYACGASELCGVVRPMSTVAIAA